MQPSTAKLREPNLQKKNYLRGQEHGWNTLHAVHVYMPTNGQRSDHACDDERRARLRFGLNVSLSVGPLFCQAQLLETTRASRRLAVAEAPDQSPPDSGHEITWPRSVPPVPRAPDNADLGSKRTNPPTHPPTVSSLIPPVKSYSKPSTASCCSYMKRKVEILIRITWPR